jgi:hypothetical protein
MRRIHGLRRKVAEENKSVSGRGASFLGNLQSLRPRRISLANGSPPPERLPIRLGGMASNSCQAWDAPIDLDRFLEGDL